MSYDLVKRLREEESVWKNFGDVRIPNFLAEAAYRIEQLESGQEEWNRICNSYAGRIDKMEAALREIAALSYWDGDSAMKIAKEALEGKDD